MRAANKNERIVCPVSGESLIPAAVYTVWYKGQGELLRGIVPKHHHGASFFGTLDGKECEWSGVPVVMERPKEEKK